MPSVDVTFILLNPQNRSISFQYHCQAIHSLFHAAFIFQSMLIYYLIAIYIKKHSIVNAS